jgi:hypothetical protein
MLSYCSSEATAKEDKANSKAGETALGEGSIMVQMTFRRQLMEFKLAKQFLYV